MASLQTVCNQIIADLRTLPGLTASPDQPGEQVNAFPILQVYPITGSWRLSAHRSEAGNGIVSGLHTIAVRVYVDRSDLSYDMASLATFGESVPHAVMAGFIRDQFGGSVVTLGDMRGGGTAPLRYEVTPVNYGGQDVLCLSFDLDVSVEEEIPV